MKDIPEWLDVHCLQLVVEHKRHWFWNKDQFRPYHFNIENIFVGGAGCGDAGELGKAGKTGKTKTATTFDLNDYSAFIRKPAVLLNKAFSKTSSIDLSSELALKLSSLFNIDLKAGCKLELAINLGDIYQQSIDWDKTRAALNTRRINLQSNYVRSLIRRKRNILNVVSDEIYMENATTITWDKDVDASGKFSVRFSGQAEDKDADKITFPAGTRLAFRLAPLRVHTDCRVELIDRSQFPPDDSLILDLVLPGSRRRGGSASGAAATGNDSVSSTSHAGKSGGSVIDSLICSMTACFPNAAKALDDDVNDDDNDVDHKQNLIIDLEILKSAKQCREWPDFCSQVVQLAIANLAHNANNNSVLSALLSTLFSLQTISGQQENMLNTLNLDKAEVDAIEACLKSVGLEFNGNQIEWNANVIGDGHLDDCKQGFCVFVECVMELTTPYLQFVAEIHTDLSKNEIAQLCQLLSTIMSDAKIDVESFKELCKNSAVEKYLMTDILSAQIEKACGWTESKHRLVILYFVLSALFQ